MVIRLTISTIAELTFKLISKLSEGAAKNEKNNMSLDKIKSYLCHLKKERKSSFLSRKQQMILYVFYDTKDN